MRAPDTSSERRLDFEQFVHLRRLEEVECHGAHGEGQARRLLLGLLDSAR